MENTVKVKAKYDATSRRFEIPSSIEWPDLESQLKESFDLERDVLVRYLDDEGELVVLSSQAEFQEALRVHERTAGLLRLFIENPARPPMAREDNLCDLQHGEHLEQVRRKKKRGNANACYKDLAAAMAPELAALETPPAAVEQYPAHAYQVEPMDAVNLQDGADIDEHKMKIKQPKSSSENQKNQKTKEPGKSKSCYVNLAEVMAAELADLRGPEEVGAISEQQTDQQEAIDAQRSEESQAIKGMQSTEITSEEGRGWFGSFEAQPEQLPKPLAPQQVKKKSPKQKSKKSCYGQLAEYMAPNFAEMNAKLKREDEHKLEEERALAVEEAVTPQNPPASTPMVTPTQGCYATLATTMTTDLAAVNLQLQRLELERARSERTQSRHPPEPSPSEDLKSQIQKGVKAAFENSSENTNTDVRQGVNHKRQTDEREEENLQKQKKPRRPKKYTKKKSCYVQLAEDMAPHLGALNDTLKKQEQKRQLQESAAAVAIPTSPMASLSLSPEGHSQGGSPGATGEPYIFVNPQGEMQSVYLSLNQEQNDGGDGPRSIPSSSSAAGEGSRNVVYPLLTQNVADVVCEQPLMSPEVMEQPEIKCEIASAYCESSSLAPEAQLISFGEPQSFNSKVRVDVERDVVIKVVEEYFQQSLPLVVNKTLQEIRGSQMKNQDKVVHKGITCDYCNTEISGIRYKCCNCTDYDLCATCESIPGLHNRLHVFIKLKYRAPGIGRKHGEMVPILKNSPYKVSKQRDKQEKKEDKRISRQTEANERQTQKILEREGHRNEYELEREQRRPEKMLEKEQKREEKWIRRQNKSEKDWKKDWKRQWKMEKQQLKIVRRRRAEMRLNEEKPQLERLHGQLSALFVGDASYPDGSIVPPGQKFLKGWLVKNNGLVKWNSLTKFECIGGSISIVPNSQINVPAIAPGQQGEISVEFIAPELPGSHDSKWQLAHKGCTFGPQFWCDIEVPSSSSVVKEEPIRTYETPKQDEPPCRSHDNYSLVNEAFESSVHTPIVNIFQGHSAETATADDGSGSEYLSSEEVPEAQRISSSSDSCLLVESVPEADSVVQSPVVSVDPNHPQDLEWDAVCVMNNEVENAHIEYGTSDDQGDMVFIRDCESDDNSSSYSDSSDEFMVVPVPPFFDPDAPLNADPVNVTVSVSRCHKLSRSASLPYCFDSCEKIADAESDSMGTVSLPSVGPASGTSGEGTSNLQVDPATEQQQEIVLEETQQSLSSPDGLSMSAMNLTPRGYSPSGVVTMDNFETPISTQPCIGSGEAVPAASQPAPRSSPVPSQHISRHAALNEESQLHSEFPGNMVSDALATAIDAVATAGRAAIATVENLISGNSSLDATATYRPENEVEITVSPLHNMDAPAPPVVTWPPTRTASSPMERLIEMGFCDRRLNQQLLNKHKNELAATIDELLTHSENNWSAERH